ncbi:phosphoribosylglycinamide formyltransferase 2 [Priestia endophytica]|jgi:phosphoribosylglycinamide formyltransferase 2|uniref:Formate-dependent phosphoribosylglycinamide formyltransferase n=1 Tax=Priestia endophytica DSM 13796 TaxID=1121089 RepID=A0A1I5YY17_9BACI|nr:phosphoribosylglycinamide formyltransferase 2 [Priestia endophytica]KAB2495402.1 phosphoribosylglycinamide formyltransferase 2 [Priestia endophytica]KYG27957.1 phosphoribosylglycinamide formyltransferase [Priestia endophytica]RAS79069.1 phosphoribosylglycinamide formyltransferase 2 [Priestia endophytica]SFQ49112.1 formate-dependent phosphoribosylglycinamide formyltransferase [Priestia endophytica DSM 13796]
MFSGKKMLLLGAGELGKEIMIEAQRFGIETVAVDRYEHAPAMHVAHKHYVIDMLDSHALRDIIQKEQPDFIVPEIEAIATDELVGLEKEGFNVVPNAKATKLTMDREGIRRFASEELNIPTAHYQFANTYEEFTEAVSQIGYPCVIKPLMSSSGKGQSICRSEEDLTSCWNIALEGGRVKSTRVIIEEFISFDSEITLLTVRAVNGTKFCAPIGHKQENGDYIESWQPHYMTEKQLKEAERIAKEVTDGLGGYGLFGVELFLAGDRVYFSEVSPRPHDTGLVTLATQKLSEFALHVRALLGFPIPEIKLSTHGASRPLKSSQETKEYEMRGLEDALALPHTEVRVFGKPNATVGRRLAVALCGAESVEKARETAKTAHDFLHINSLD